MILLWTMAFWRFPHPNPSQLALLVWSQSEKKMTEPPKWETRFIKMGNKSRKAKNKEKEIHLGSKYSLWPSGALRRWLYKGYSRPAKGVFQRLHVMHQFTDPPIRKSWRITDISNQFNSRLQTKKNARSPQIRALCNKPLEESASSISGAWVTRFPSLPSDFGNGGGGRLKETPPWWGLSGLDLKCGK